LTTIGYATLQIIPSLVGVTDAVNKQLGGLPNLGKTAGKALGDGIASGVDAAAARVEQASSKVVAARNKEADAAGKVKTAEAQLSALRDKGVTDAGRLTAAEEKSLKAKRDLETASRNLVKATQDQTSAQDKLAEAHKRVDKASGAAADSGGRFSGMLGGLKTKLGEASGGIDGLKGKIGGLGTTLLSNLGLGVAGGIAGIGASLIAMGDQFEQVNKKLAFTTGATGKALEDMNASVRTIAKTTPASMTDIATSVADVAKATQLTGQPLEDMTVRMLKLGRMGKDVDVATLTQSMRAFGVPADQMAAQMDNLYRASVSSGMSMQDLSEMALKGAPQFKQFGLSLDDTAAMMGNLFKAGVRGEDITKGMNRAMVELSKGGGDVKEKLKDAVGQIDAMIKAGDTAGATEMASKLFGTRSAGQFVDAIKAGKLNLDDLNGSLDKQKGGIMDAAGAVPTMAGAWQLLKNNVMIELEPIVTKIFKAMTDGILWFRTEGVGIIQGFKKNFEWIGPIAAGVTAMVVAWKAWTTAITLWKTVTTAAIAVQEAFNVAMDANPIGLIILALVGLGTALVVAYKHSETFRNIVNSAWQGIKDVIGAVWGWLSTTVFPGLKSAWDAIGQGVMWLWHNAIQPAWDGIKLAFQVGWDAIKVIWELWKAEFHLAADAAMWLWHNAIEPVWAGIKTAFQVGWDFVKDIFDKLKSGFQTAADAIKSVWSGVGDAIKGVFHGIVDVIKAPLHEVGKMLQGLPDVHIPGTNVDISVHGFGDKLAGLSDGGYTGAMPIDQIAGVVHGGEHVIKAASRKRIENAYPGLLDYLNNVGALPGYAGGGQVTDEIGDVEQVAKRFNLNLVSGRRNEPGSYHNSGEAGDFSDGDKTSQELSFATYMAQNFGPHLAELIHDQPNWTHNIKDGKDVGPFGKFYTMGQAGYHGDHVHVAVKPGAFAGISPSAFTTDGSSPAAGQKVPDWDAIAQLESGGRWDIPYGDADSTGGLQIQDRTWVAFGGTAIAPHAYQATKAQQIAVAEKILAAQGPNAWAGGKNFRWKNAPAPTPAAASSDQTPARAPESAAPAASSSPSSSSLSVPSSLSGLSTWGLDLMASGAKNEPGNRDPMAYFGKAASAAVGGQVSSLLGVFGVPDSPGWLQAASKFVSGISVSRSSSASSAATPATPVVASPAATPATPLPDAVHVGTRQPPGPQVVYNIAARDTEDAFIRAQRLERERAAAKLSVY
jgi:TP901 family phage tail tape measure protein